MAPASPGPDGVASIAGMAARQARALVAGVTFLTRIPPPRAREHDADDLARSSAYFPVIGLVVGLAGATAFAIGARLWTPLIAAALSTACTVRLTGALHEDALADSFDAFGGGWTTEQVLAILKDSRIGSYGAVGLVLVLALKLGALAALAGPARAPGIGDVTRALVAAHVLARWSSLPLLWRYRYVRDAGGKSRPFATSVTTTRLVAGTLLAALLAAAALAPFGIARAGAALLVAWGVTVLGGRYFARRIGGITGDCLGAANQFVELATYLTLAAWRHDL